MDIATLGLKVDSSGLSRGMSDLREFGRVGTDTSDRLDTSSRSIVTSFGSITRALGGLSAAIGAGALLNSAITQSRDFGAALAEVGTLIEGTAQQTEYLESTARELAKTYGGSATSQAQAFYQAISAGASSVEDAANTLDVANRLAIGGVTDVTTAVDGLTTAVNAYGPGVLSAQDASDSLFVAMKGGKTTVEELSKNLGTVIPIAAAVGVSFDEVTGSIAALTTQGLSTTMATTGLRQTLAAILAPTKAASDEALRLGLAFDVQSLKAKGLGGFLQDVIAKTGGSQESMAKLFGSVEALNAVLSFAGGGGEKFNAIMGDMAEKAGATQTAFDKMSDSAQQRLNVVMAEMTDRLLTVGSALLTVLVPALEAMSATMTFVADNSDVLITAISVLAAKQLPALAVGAYQAVAGFVAYNGIVGIATIATNVLGFAMKALPFFAVIAAVVGTYRAMSYLVEQTGSVGGAFEAIKDIAKEVFGERIPDFLRGVGYITDGVGTTMRGAILGALADILDGVPEFANKVIGTFVGAKDAIVAAWQAIPGALKAIIGEAMNGIIDGVQKGVSGLVSALNIIPGIDLTPPDLSGWKVEVGKVESATGAAKAAFDAAFGADYTGEMASNLRGMADGATALGDGYIEMGKGLINGATAPLNSLEALKSVVDESKTAIEGVIDPTVAAAGALGGGGSGGKGKKGLSDAAKDAAKAMKDAAKSAKELADEIQQLEFDADPVKKYNAELEHLGELSKAGLSDGAYAKAVEKLNDELAQSYPLIGDVSDAFGEFVSNGLKDFKGFVSSIVDSFKGMLAKMIATAARNKIMLSMGIGGGGIAGTATQAAAGGGMGGVGLGAALGGIGSRIGAIGSVFASSAMGSLSTFATGGIGAGLGGIGASLGAATTGVAGFAAAAGSLVPVIGAAALAFSFFKSKTKELDAGIRVNINGNKALVESYKKVEKSRFWGLSRSTSTGYEAVNDSPLADAYKTIYAGAEEASWALGMSSKALRSYTAQLNVSTQGMDEAQANAAALETLQSAQNGLAGKFFAALGRGATALIQSGEEAGAAMQRLAASVQTASGLLDLLGSKVDLVGLSGAKTATVFISLLGGLDAANNAVSGYIGTFYSLEDKAKLARRNMREQLRGVFDDIPKSLAGYKRAVDQALAAGNEKRAANLISKSGAFAEWIDLRNQLNDAAKSAKNLTDKTKESVTVAMALNGKTRTYANLQQQAWALMGMVEKQRRFELLGLNASEKALQKRVWALQDSAEAEQKAASVLSERMGIQRQIWQLMGNEEAIRADVVSSLDASNQALQLQFYALSDQKAAQEALAKASEEATASIQAMIDAIAPANFASKFEYERARGLAANGLGAQRVTATGVPLSVVPTATPSVQTNSDLIAEVRAIKAELRTSREETRTILMGLNMNTQKIRKNSDTDQAIGQPPVRAKA